CPLSRVSRLDDRADGEQGDDRHGLRADDDFVDVDRGPPTDRPVLDDERPHRGARRTEAAAHARVLRPFWRRPAATAAADLRHRYDHHAVLVHRLTDRRPY